MGCATCSNNDGSGTPRGCRNNGNCASGGCNKLEVFDWLADMELPHGQKQFDCVEVRFKNSRKGFYRNHKDIPLQSGDVVAVEGSPGTDVGVVTLAGELVRTQMSRKGVGFDSPDVKKIYRKAEEQDVERWQAAREREKECQTRSRQMAIDLGLSMKISDVEFQGDGNKATFYYTADERVDFRQLIKVMADEFKCRIEMRQIGARQEASRVGGIGSCGRELCCTTWLTDFRSVSTAAARYQQLSLNPQKLAGQCGKLKCCLNFELDMYLEAFKEFPSSNTRLKTKKGNAFCMKTDIFKRIMYFAWEDEMVKTPIALPLEKVQEVLAMNKDGKFPDDLTDYTFEIEVEEEPDYANVVGQDSLTRFDGIMKKRKKKKRRPGGNDKKPSGGGQRAGAKNTEGRSAPKGDNRNRPNRNKKKSGEGGGNAQPKAQANSGSRGEGQSKEGGNRSKSRSRNNNRRRGGGGNNNNGNSQAKKDS